jgi:L-2,4-diaminobutyric acid acetyltransferase
MVPEQAALSGMAVTFRNPVAEDGPAVRQLVEDTPGVEPNSLRHYTLWFRDFADGSLVATVDDELVGVLTGYRRPQEPDTYFVWQTAVSPRHCIPMLGVKLFEHAVDRQLAKGARFVEATVSVGNEALVMVLKNVAMRHSGGIQTCVLFPGSLFPGGTGTSRTAGGGPGSHLDELLYRIGPLSNARHGSRPS